MDDAAQRFIERMKKLTPDDKLVANLPEIVESLKD